MKLTPEQKKMFNAHRDEANERILHGCVPTLCSCSEWGTPCRKVKALVKVKRSVENAA